MAYGITKDADQIMSGAARVLVQYRYSGKTLPDPSNQNASAFLPVQLSDLIDTSSATSPEPLASNEKGFASGDKGYWIDIGATDGGTTPTFRRPVSEVRVDHALIGVEAETPEASIATTMAEQSFRNLRLALSEDNEVADGIGTEKRLNISMNGPLQELQLAVIQRHRGTKKYKAWVFHTVQVEGGDISIPMVPGGGLSNIPVTFRAFSRSDLGSSTGEIGHILDETP